MRFCTDDFFPILRVIVATRHNYADFFVPCRAQLQKFSINLHRNRARIRHDHRLARQKISAVLFVMVDNIFAQGLNGRICPQHTLHLPQHLFAFFNRCSVRLLFQRIVGRINQSQRVFVEMQLDDAAFVVDRSGCAVLYCLRHIVNINIIAKNFTGISVFCRNGCSRKAYVGCVGQGIVDDSRIANHGMRFLFALLVFLHDDFFIKTILSAVGFVCHHHNVPPFRQWTLPTFKLEHGGKYDAVCLPPIQQFTQIFLAGRLNRCLA